jgi:hypothetical protein
MIQVFTHPAKSSLNRQVNHWLQAASRLSELQHLASGNAWQGIEHDLGIILRETLQKSVQQVVANAESLKRQLASVTGDEGLRAVKRGLMDLRNQYLRAEETIHFYTVAINSRTTSNVAALLRACDIICVKSMQEILMPLGKETPKVLTYIDKGIGASILKAGLRLWDGNLSPIATIKVTQHNLFRPTAIIHETGHQVSHILDWNRQLANGYVSGLAHHPKAVGAAFASWAGEIAADAFAFVHTGYAAVASLHDVISGYPASVFSFHPQDPHPISYVRVLMGIEMCRQFYGSGPWDQLQSSFLDDYNINLVNFPSVGLIKMCMEALPEAVQLTLSTPYSSFNNQALSKLIAPERVSPASLERLEYLAGPALFTSHAWIWKECIKLLALNGYKIGVGEGDLNAMYKQQEEWMMKLGFSVELN